MDNWIAALVVIISGILVFLIVSCVKKKIKAICEKSGHKWSNCKCLRCGMEEHEWKYLEENERTFQIKSSGSGGRNNVPIKGFGQYSVHNHLCAKCGKIMQKKSK